MTKRVLDVIFASLGLFLAAPLLVLLAVLIKVDSPGRVIFSQPRLGKGGKPFRLHKLRKFPDHWDSAGPGVTVAGDARMTRIGRYLERTKLDELPQLWSILRGEMSFVGPRPESLRYADLFRGELAEVLDYVPGIFGPNQIAFRNESELYPPDRDPDDFYRRVLFPQKAKADIAYFRGASLWSDLAWIARGLWVSLAGAIDWRRMIGLHGPILLLDLLSLEAAWLLANLIRFEGLPWGGNWPVFLSGLWLVPAVVIPTLVLFGAYRHPVRYFAFTDAVRLVLGSSFGWIVAYLIMVGVLHRNASFFLAPFALLLSLASMGTVRLLRREWWRESNRRPRHDHHPRILVYGAGARGSALAAFLDQGFVCARVIGFLDDQDALFRGRVIQGRRVLGSERDLSTVHAVHAVNQIWTSFEPEIHKHRRLRHWCEQNRVKLVVVPTSEPFRSLCGYVPGEAPFSTELPQVSSSRTRARGDQAVA